MRIDYHAENLREYTFCVDDGVAAATHHLFVRGHEICALKMFAWYIVILAICNI